MLTGIQRLRGSRSRASRATGNNLCTQGEGDPNLPHWLYKQTESRGFMINLNVVLWLYDTGSHLLTLMWQLIKEPFSKRRVKSPPPAVLVIRPRTVTFDNLCCNKPRALCTVLLRFRQLLDMYELYQLKKRLLCSNSPVSLIRCS